MEVFRLQIEPLCIQYVCIMVHIKSQLPCKILLHILYAYLLGTILKQPVPNQKNLYLLQNS